MPGRPCEARALKPAQADTGASGNRYCLRLRRSPASIAGALPDGAQTSPASAARPIITSGIAAAARTVWVAVMPAISGASPPS